MLCLRSFSWKFPLKYLGSVKESYALLQAMNILQMHTKITLEYYKLYRVDYKIHWIEGRISDISVSMLTKSLTNGDIFSLFCNYCFYTTAQTKTFTLTFRKKFIFTIKSNWLFFWFTSWSDQLFVVSTRLNSIFFHYMLMYSSP